MASKLPPMTRLFFLVSDLASDSGTNNFNYHRIQATRNPLNLFDLTILKMDPFPAFNYAWPRDQDGTPPTELSPVPDEVDDAELAGKSSQVLSFLLLCLFYLLFVFFFTPLFSYSLFLLFAAGHHLLSGHFGGLSGTNQGLPHWYKKTPLTLL
ncbi:hypothetical protein COLO4_13199 [Corchorus olitorius]|uniref:Uncharacterized protein n=1 Tax=Corchorus olitorius TaxID=93759 RepID=A0A1R3JXR9_9ROSI|nr:hypothetical protein COLO4_13199 [Corchorus olitorius]